MPERFFLYIDILGFKELIKSGDDLSELFQIVDRLNVHKRADFKSIVFSDTILVYGSEDWAKAPNEAVMWLIEFAQDLFYRLIVKNIHFRAYITTGNFHHYELKNIEVFYGEALVDCYEREKEIKCTGVFLDEHLAKFSDIFHLTRYDENSYFVHVMQHLDQVSVPYQDYPIVGERIKETTMEWWIAYLLFYTRNIYGFASDVNLADSVRIKYKNTWNMIATRHPGLVRICVETGFNFRAVANLDWTEPFRRIGTDKGSWG